MQPGLHSPGDGLNNSILRSPQAWLLAPSIGASRYVLEDQDWVGPPGRPINPGMVLYAMADGSFAVWDPARNYWKQRGNRDVQERVSGYVFSPRNI